MQKIKIEKTKKRFRFTLDVEYTNDEGKLTIHKKETYTFCIKKSDFYKPEAWKMIEIWLSDKVCASINKDFYHGVFLSDDWEDNIIPYGVFSIPEDKRSVFKKFMEE